QHLVGMPQRPLQVGLAEPAGELQRPQADRDRGECAGQQVERTEAERPEREALPRSLTRLFDFDELCHQEDFLAPSAPDRIRHTTAAATTVAANKAMERPLEMAPVARCCASIAPQPSRSASDRCKATNGT